MYKYEKWVTLKSNNTRFQLEMFTYCTKWGRKKKTIRVHVQQNKALTFFCIILYIFHVCNDCGCFMLLACEYKEAFLCEKHVYGWKLKTITQQ